MSNNPSDVAQLKQAVLQQRLRKRMASYREGQQDARIPVADRSRPLPLSLAQQRLWFLDRLDKAASAAYHMPAALRLFGALDVPVLQATLDRLVARHESLRTSFVARDGVPHQQLASEDCGFALRHEDLSVLPDEEREAAVASRMAEEARIDFDLAQGPVIRGRLLRLAEQEHVLLITQHHIVSDGWSVSILVREVAALYTAFRRGESDPLPPLEIHYADYAQWQRQYLQGEELKRQLDFWRSHLAGAPALLSLPLDRPRPAVQSHAGDSVPIAVSAELTSALRALSQGHDATLYMTLMAAWGLLLSRLSGQTDVVIGTPVANRQRREVENLIGFFVNTLALRLRFDDRPTVSALLAQARETTLAAFAHQDLPFEQVVEALQPQRSLSHDPIAQTSFTWHNQPTTELALPELNLVVMETGFDATQADLSLHLAESGGGLKGKCVYATALFDRETIERWAGSFVRLLEGMVADPSAPADALPLLSDSERRLVLHDFNATEAAYPREKSLRELFEEQAAARPEALAVVFEDRSLTYAELDGRANQLAHYLIGLGVQPDDRVAICMERGIELVIGLMGVLKAGSAYVPLDPAYPADRLHFMLRDAAPKALLTQAELEEYLSPGDVPVLRLDVDLPVLARGLPSQRPITRVRPADLAYVIYTSGSTGLPKGVMVEHGGLSNLAHAQSELFGVEPSSRVLQFASTAFDASVSEVAMTLSRGACLCLAPRHALMAGAPLQTTLRELAITHVTLPAAAVTLFGDAELPALRTLIVAGDVCPPAVAQRWHDKVRFFNAYGPTETTVCATAQLCRVPYEGTVPIGPPIANMRVYILDPRGEPVPVGVEGEICIGGDGIARGYLNRPELTAERFSRDPFRTDPDARLYRSGDRGRWLSNGTIEYLGRRDFQVKIRGFRIELGEIEAKLSACAGVREAAVLAREDTPGDKRLVAYVVAAENVALQAVELRAALSTQLPDYMLPSAFVVLDAMPLTVNGKLDRRALPAPEASAVATRDYEPPLGAIEVAVAAMWQELLDVPRVGRRDHFFELGGHSLLVVEMVERLRAQGLSGEVRAIFTAPALSDYAATLRQDAAAESEIPPNRLTTDTVAITPELLPLVELAQPEIDRIVATVPGGAANIQDVYPLLPLQEGLLFQHLLETEGDTYLSRELMAFDTRQHLDDFLAVLQQVIARHDILRTAILWEGLSRPVQVVYRTVELPLTTIVSSGERDPLDEFRDATDPQTVRLDLRRAPLLSAQVAEDALRGEWLLSLLVHHLICDHVTLELVLDEVRTLLRGEAARLTVPVPLRNVVAQAGRVPLSDHETYFREQLGDIEEPTAPFGIVDVQVKSSELATIVTRIDDALALRLRSRAAELGVPPSVLFHVAWAQVLARCTGLTDVVFGTVLSGRLQGAAGADRALGMLINTLPLRISLEMDARQVVQQSYERMVALLAHEQAPLSLAQRCSGVAPSRPLFTSSLNYRQSASADGEDPEGLWAAHGLRPISGARDLANFPLGLKVDDFGHGFAVTAVCVRGIEAERITAHLATALGTLVTALETADAKPLSQMDILPAAERAELFDRFNAPRAEYPTGELIQELFERQVALRPTAVAIVFEDAALTYAELNTRANQLAHYLIALGVKPDDRVALCVERGLEMVVGLLGILKAGGAYLPLDPSYPTERLQSMLRDAAPKVLLTESDLEEHLAPADVAVVRLDVDLPVLARSQPAHDPDPRALGLAPHSLAYVIYTSGSTGVPKGVMVEHRSLCNMALAHAGDFGVGEDSRVLQFVSIAFDVCTAEVFMALSSGATLHLAQRQKLLPGEPLQTTLRDLAITHIMLPVNVAALCDPDAVPELRCLIVGGDVCPAALVRRWHRRVRFFNAYGPTETTVCATVQSCESLHGDSVPIGRPFANARIYILDRHYAPAPVGVAGEIYIGGSGVARGYLNRAELTAERFLRDPFRDESHARMYKTGDRGRWLSDGTIEFLGRNDSQVKIRGFRVELGEIEAKLGACAGVREAVVVAREEASGDKRLAAYFVTDAGSELQVADLRDALSRQLPDFMVPSSFTRLETLPLTANGKPDRKALPAPDASSTTVQDYAAPEGEIERSVAAIWEELLAVPRVGRHDNFFELGGHSLMVVGLVERLRQRGISVALGDVFQQPTLMALAASAAAMPASVEPVDQTARIAIPPGCRRITPEMLPLADLDQSEIDAIVASVPGGIDEVQDIYGLSPLQEGILFHHLIQEEGDPYASRMVLSFDRAERLDAFVGALQRVVDRHDTLRTAFRWMGLAKPVQVVFRNVMLPVEEIRAASPVLPRLLDAASLERVRLDPRQAPLLTACIAREENDGPAYLVLHYHHLIGDHQSMALLVSEAHAFLNGQEARLEPPLPYRHFIAQARQTPAQQHEAYFRDTLGDVIEPTAPFGVIDTHGSGAEVTKTMRRVTGEVAHRIREAARREKLSPAVLFHAAWASVLGRLSGCDDVVFGSVLSGRQGIRGAERAVGMFINTLPLRLRLTGLSVQQAIRETAARLTGLLEHEQAPLAWAQRASGVRPPLPLFTALLNYTHNTPLPAGEEAMRRASGIELLQAETHNNYPLTMTVGDASVDFDLIALTTAGIDGELVCECLQSALSSLVDALAGEPESPFERISVVPAAMESSLLELGRGEIRTHGRELMLPAAITRQATRTPEAVALRCGGLALSYRELESRTNRLGQLLIEQGVGRGSRVGVHLGRSIELLIAQLAIMKTGAAYVPLEPSQAPERLAAMVRDAEIALVLLDSRTMRLPIVGVDTVFLDGAASERDWLADHPDEAPAIDLQPDDAIYLLYTSGSTGEPKGVEVHHGGVIDYCAFARANYYADQLAGSLVATSPAFDLTLPSLYVPLLTGGCVELLPEEEELEALSGRLAADRAAVLLRLTPSHVRALLTLSDAAPRRSAHVFVIGGEPFEPALARRLQAKFPASQIYNHYGPTETVVGSAWFDVTANLDALDPRIPIGRPMENTRLYVLDEQGRLQPRGMPGELYIGGAGVAKGYVNRPSLTEEKFVPNPFGEGRLYRSGDRVLWRTDGQLEFLGRVDRQVKLRGFRIELGEIENRLKQSAHVRDAVVCLLEERLVAYVVPVDDDPQREAAVHAQLSAQLPAYMLPSAYVWLDALPLTVNGKVNLHALPAPDLFSPACAFEAPQGEVEETIAAIWRDLLKLTSVGRQDNFQLLGGHSLLMMQLAVRVREQFDVDVPLRTIFEAPVLSELADVVVRAQLDRYSEADVAELERNLDSLSEEQLLSMLADSDGAAQ